MLGIVFRFGPIDASSACILVLIVVSTTIGAIREEAKSFRRRVAVTVTVAVAEEEEEEEIEMYTSRRRGRRKENFMIWAQ